jgi:hypothetical protein
MVLKQSKVRTTAAAPTEQEVSRFLAGDGKSLSCGGCDKREAARQILKQVKQDELVRKTVKKQTAEKRLDVSIGGPAKVSAPVKSAKSAKSAKSLKSVMSSAVNAASLDISGLMRDHL